ncbi:MAG TPA: cohesin domain-containing protein [Terriglobales bacterium]|nr:cohesin domain-containing protein [Terriglobales bacterium]
MPTARKILPALFLPLLLLVPLRADRFKVAIRSGQYYEAHKQFDNALYWYDQALKLRPQDPAVILEERRVRFEAAVAHIEKGRKLAADHRNAEALAEFEKARLIDPTDFVAEQEIEKIKREEAPAVAPGQPVTPAAAQTLQQRLARAAGPVELGPISTTPITLELTNDSRVAYDTVGKLAGLNVVYDPDYRGSRVVLNLQGVTLREALRILNLESTSFYTVVTPNTIFVANDTQAKRNELEQQVIKTFYLKNATDAQDLTQIQGAIRGLLPPPLHMQAVASQMAIVMRDTPDKLAVTQKIIDDLDKAPPEVLVDIQVLQVSRDVARKLGILPPTELSIGLVTPSSTSTNSSGGTTTTTTQPTLNDLRHLNSKDWSVTISQATLDALLTNSQTKAIQTPQLRAVQGQDATLQIGQRIPIATGSFQPGIGGIGINPLVNTQFQYIPVGVNVDLTPWVNGDDVTLKAKVEISSVDSFQTIGGIQQPVIGQRVVNHVIRLREGESNILGGMFSDQTTKNVSGIPFLSAIPGLKWLFSDTSTDHREEEDLIVLTPHILRHLDVTPFNREALDTGTQNNMELRELPPATLASPAPSAQAPAQAIPLPAGPPSLQFAPAQVSAQVGAPFTVALDLNNVTAAYALALQLNYDPRMVEVQNVVNGGFLSNDGQVVAVAHLNDPTTGTTQINASRGANAGGISGSGAVLVITFRAKAAGVTTISVSRVVARNPSGEPIQVGTASATIRIR